MMSIRKHLLVCPHCQSELGFKTYSKYFYHGTAHVEQCPHCHQGMKPEKEPLPTVKCFQFGSTFGVLTSVLYLIYIEDNFLHAVIFSVLLFLIPLAILCTLTYQRINFIRAV